MYCENKKGELTLYELLGTFLKLLLLPPTSFTARFKKTSTNTRKSKMVNLLDFLHKEKVSRSVGLNLKVSRSGSTAPLKRRQRSSAPR